MSSKYLVILLMLIAPAIARAQERPLIRPSKRPWQRCGLPPTPNNRPAR
jgi:hypothetical protein